MILMLILLYYLENYAIICIEMVTYPFNPTECPLSVPCWFPDSLFSIRGLITRFLILHTIYVIFS